MNLIPWPGFMFVAMFVAQFIFQVAAIVTGLVIWDRFLRQRG